MLERIRTKTMSPALAININDWYASIPMIEPAAVLGVVLFDGGHIPRLEKNRRDGGNQIRDLGGNAVDAGSSFSDQTGRPGHIPDKQTVGKSGHQPEQGGRDQRNGELQHHAQDLLVHIPQPEEPVQSGDAPQEQSRQQVGQDDGDQKTGNAKMESGNKCNIKINRVSVARMPSMAKSRTSPLARTNCEAICRKPEVIQ
mgnify:CR=1 FL=1